MPTRKASKIARSSPANKDTNTLRRLQKLEKEMTLVIREMQEKVRQLEYLNNFSSLMNSTLDTHEVQIKALEGTCALLGCRKAALYLMDRKKGELYWKSPVHAEATEVSQEIYIAINNQSLVGYVAMTGESLVVNDTGNHPYHRRKLPIEKDAQTLICVPLKVKDKLIGVLQGMDKLPSIPPRKSQHTWPDFYDDDKKLLETLGHQVATAIENSLLYSEIKKNFFETVEALAEAIEKKDHYTGGHTKRVVYYATCIAKYLDITPEQLERIRLGAILHDVGKIGIEDKILKKEASLTPEEWKVMQTHPDIGYDIMGRVEGLKDVIGGMRYHHERWDGKGYPFGLKGEEIPLIARIISVADTYDAMISTRPYRKGMDPKKAHDEIMRYSGTQFDPTVVQAFSQAFLQEKMGKGSGGSTLSNCD